MSLGNRAGPSRAPWRGERPRSFTRSSSRHWCGSKAGAWATRWISKRTCSCTKTFWQGRPPPGALRNRSKRRIILLWTAAHFCWTPRSSRKRAWPPAARWQSSKTLPSGMRSLRLLEQTGVDELVVQSFGAKQRLARQGVVHGKERDSDNGQDPRDRSPGIPAAQVRGHREGHERVLHDEPDN